uniref:Uncharacterized protein n=1 Tax=Tetranychus urticae TaxID=32264 RepID=T1KQB5_TETUR
MTIPDIAPSITVTVQYTLNNPATSETVFCNRFRVKLCCFAEKSCAVKMLIIN